MFDIGWDEMLFTAIVAIIVIGPKELPRALRTAGQWIAKVRRVSGHFRSGIESMIREAELADMEKEWRAKNEAVMAHGPAAASAEAALIGQDPGTSFPEPLAPDGPAPGPAASQDEETNPPRSP